MFKVSLTTPKGQQTEIQCTISACSIGKGDENLVVIRGWSIAKKHATIHKRTDGIYIEDHGSMTRTEVNGKPIENTYGPLSREDVILIGGYSMRVLEEGANNAEPPTPPAAPAAKPAAATAAPPKPAPAAAPAAPAATAGAGDAYLTYRKEVHQKLITQMDLRRIDVSRMNENELRNNTSALIDEIIKNDTSLPPTIDRKILAKQVLDETVGLGPLEDLLSDPTVSEIMVNRYDEIFIERRGRLETAGITFTSEQAVVGAIERIVAPIGRRIDESSPMVDARLKDGSRVNAVIPPLALKGANITIRKFSKTKLTDQDLIKYGSIASEMVAFIKVAVHQRANIIISGGTGSGKTTLLNVLSNYIPDDERIVTVEDAAELQLSQPNLISLEARPPNSEGKGAVTIRDLVKNCLRMRPDRIVVGECRGGEALDMLQAMNTGHDGSLTTAHANTPRDCIARLEVMVLMSGLDLPVQAIREQISSAVDIIIQQSRFADGSRKVTHVSEVTGIEGSRVSLQDIFVFKEEGYDTDGKLRGRFVATGQIPEFYEDLRNRGLNPDLGIFQLKGN